MRVSKDISNSKNLGITYYTVIAHNDVMSSQYIIIPLGNFDLAYLIMKEYKTIVATNGFLRFFVTVVFSFGIFLTFGGYEYVSNSNFGK